MTVVPVSQSILGFTGGVLSSMTAYSILVDQLRTDARALDQSLQRFRRTIEYGLPLFIRDEEFLQVMNALEVTSRRRQTREKSLWRKLKQAGQWNWNAGLAGAIGAFHEWRQS
ncbi:hypothetical protein BGZ65_004299 [Modicella reniformis]|uniref:Uncharacterized protein n=1 Tax=Modicella reniformis TaxID=1440133 RepID=A0A9P6SLR1_9FUNG|nr:hypothetical protein BGZ65_004299 [Modicella reniformis]